MKPVAVDLFCGLGGWTDGLLAEGYDVIGFDIERHQYGDQKYPGMLAIQDVLTLDGAQFRNAALIVASPPCQEFSYMAMPWSLAKQKRAKIKADLAAQKRLTTLFDACFRIQREACAAAGRHIPLVVENVRGAQEWVGRARWNYGSSYLWGDVPALMPPTKRAVLKNGVTHRANGSTNFHQGKYDSANETGVKRPGRTMCYPAGSAIPDVVKGRTGKLRWMDDGTKVPSSAGRRAASAMIAKIPLPLSRHIAATFYPQGAHK